MGDEPRRVPADRGDATCSSAPRRAARTRSRASSSPTAASFTPTATGCSARSTTPRTRSRRRCCAPGGRWRSLRGPQLAALVALHDRDQHLAERDREAPEAGAADRLRAGRRPARRPARAAGRVGLGRAVPRRAARARGRLRRPRGALRAARERRARVRRRASAPAGQPARGADPARGARLLGQGVRRDARDDAPPRSTAPCSGRARRSRTRLPEQSQQETRRTLGDERDRARSSTSTSTPGSAATSTASSRC